MARRKTSLAGLFAHLLAPVTDAIQDETGKRVTGTGWVRVLRGTVSGWLRKLADIIAPAPEPVSEPIPAPVATEPAAVELPPVEPVAVTVEPAPQKPERKRTSKPGREVKAMPTAARSTKKPTTAKASKPAKEPAKRRDKRSSNRKPARSAA